MVGVINRIPHVVCEAGTCFSLAAFTEYVTVIPGNSDLRDQRHQIEVVLCRQHEAEFQRCGLIGTVTAHGDEIAERVG